MLFCTVGLCQISAGSRGMEVEIPLALLQAFFDAQAEASLGAGQGLGSGVQVCMAAGQSKGLRTSCSKSHGTVKE